MMNRPDHYYAGAGGQTAQPPQQQQQQQPQQRDRVSAEDRAAFHVPEGGHWFYRQAPALEPAFLSAHSSSSDAAAAAAAAADVSHHPHHNTPGAVVLVWDKTACGRRLYGVYPSHELLWRAVTSVPLEHRHGYELIREHAACKFYLDFELYVSTATSDESQARMLREIDEAFRAYLRLIKGRVAETSKLDFLPALTVLNGTRAQRLSEAKAARMGFGGAAPDGLFPCLKISFHVIAQGVAFAHFGDVRHCVESLPSFASLLPEASLARPFAACQAVVDLSVYNKNKNFRLLSCRKLGDSTPLTFDPHYNEHPAELDALVTLVRGLRVVVSSAAASSQSSGGALLTRASFPQQPQQPSLAESDAERLRRTQPLRLGALRAALQALLVRFGDTNTQVRGLHQTDGWSLRWECRNCGVRPCLLSTSEHTSNQVLLWLVPPPDVFAMLLSPDQPAIILDEYIVRYKCMSSECGRALGTIGSVRWHAERSYFEIAETRFPPHLEPAQHRPASFCRRTQPLPHALLALPLPSSLSSSASSSRRTLLPPPPAPPRALLPPPPPPVVSAMATDDDEAADHDHEDEDEDADDERQDNAGAIHHNNDVNDDPMLVEQEPVAASASSPRPPPPGIVAAMLNHQSSDRTERAPSPPPMGAEPPPPSSDPSASSSSPSPQPPTPQQPANGEEAEGGMPMVVVVPSPPTPGGEDEGEEPRPDPEDPESNQYELVKARFERRCFKILSPFAYANLVHMDRREPDLYTPQQLRQLYANLYFFERHPDTNEWLKLLFVPRWMGDVNIRQVTEIVVEPRCTRAESVYNLWSPFAAERLPPLPEPDDTARSAVDALVAPFVRHLHEVIANEVQEHTDWLLDYLAMILQRPSQPTHVAISIYGAQGCGKGILFAFFREKVLGLPCSYQTANPEQDLLSRFQNGCVARVFIQVDEVKSLHGHSDALKNLITNNTLQLEKKGKDIITVRNFCNLLFTSNHESALYVPTDDRRFTLFRASARYKGNLPYLRELSAHLDRPEVARAMYQFLMRRDLSAYGYDMQASRPITQYYREAQASAIPVTAQFLSALVNNLEAASTRMPTHLLYQQYVAFHHAGNHRTLLTDIAFSRAVRHVDGLAKVRSGRGYVYALDHPRVRAHLLANREYDEEATLG